MPDKRKYADRAKYLIRAVAKRRKKIREMAIEYKGGRCVLCGYDKCIQALDFHHIGGKGKDFGISDKGYTRSWERVKKEIDKCILVCANCHRELHVGIKQLPREIEVEKRGELREA
ncbi:MAG: hypothetical protein Q8P74_01195 [bacterium]|nr:hypothetical protein [bacterium]